MTSPGDGQPLRIEDRRDELERRVGIDQSDATQRLGGLEEPEVGLRDVDRALERGEPEPEAGIDLALPRRGG